MFRNDAEVKHCSHEEGQVSGAEENSAFQDAYRLGQWFSAVPSESLGSIFKEQSILTG